MFQQTAGALISNSHRPRDDPPGTFLNRRMPSITSRIRPTLEQIEKDRDAIGVG